MAIGLSLSKVDAAFLLHCSECLLLLGGFVLVAGLVGEYVEAWHRHMKKFEILVILGVAIELFADGGIFMFSNHLQVLSDLEISALLVKASNAEVQAGQANKQAGEANREAARAQERIALANSVAALAREKAALADVNAATANDRAAQNELKAEQEHLARVKIEDRMGGFRLSNEALSRIRVRLGRFRNTPYRLSTNTGPVETQFLVKLDGMMREAGWIRLAPGTGAKPATIVFKVDEQAIADIATNTGIVLQLAESKWEEWGRAALAFQNALQVEGIPSRIERVRNGFPTDSIRFLVGARE